MMDGEAPDNPVWDEEAHELRVMERKCSACIFGPSSILLAKDTRNLVAKARQDDAGNIICHKTTKVFAGDVPGAMCHGYWTRFFQHTHLGRLARTWNLVHWWKEEECSGSSS